MPDTTLLSLTSAAGADALVPLRLEASEGISELFRFQVDAVAASAIDPATVLDKPACVTLRVGDGTSRHFHGLVSEFGPIGREGPDDLVYRMVLSPRLLSAGLSEDCRMFFNKGADDIIKTVLGETGTATVTFKLLGAATPRDATAQFNETALDFATRLMEEEGWFYFFQHSAGDHELIVADGNAAFPAIPDATLRFGGSGSGELGDVLTAWHAPSRVTHGEVSLSDHDPTTPDKQLKNKQQTVLGHAGVARRPVFHWPALTDATGEVTARAKIRMEAAEAGVSLVESAGSFGALVPGGRFNLQPATGAAKPYVVRHVDHAAESNPRHAGGGEAYSNRFTAFPHAVPWRQPVVTPRPRMEGLHTAVVLVPSGEEVHTDAQGRVKIRFFWDWRADATADNSPFVRVVQPWAGNGWGGQFIPRGGTEVAVAFMDADPDRPVVVGGFYNGADKPIFPEGEKTKTGFRTRSTLKGGTDAFNELSFTDEKDKELVFIHAQKNMTTEVEHDELHTVDHDRTRTVKGKETVTVKGDRAHEVSDGHESLTVKTGNRTVLVEKGNQAMTVKTGNHSLEISQGNQAVTLKMGNQATKLSMGNQSTVLDMGNHSTQAKLGDVTIKADVGNITMEALQSITLKVGANTLKLSQQGVEIKGLMVKVEGTVMTEIKGVMLKADGTAMLMLKGGITMVN